MTLADNAPEKWEGQEHTKVKHEILRKYLYAWSIKLGKFNRTLCYFDGFAGRGKYNDNSLGSPLIAIELANNLFQQSAGSGKRAYFDKFVCTSIEKDKDNFANLQQTFNQEKSKYQYIDKGITPIWVNGEFKEVINDMLQSPGARLNPSFFFIDPFGFSGIPFTMVKDILSIPKTEVFITFMTRDINRFVVDPKLAACLTELFGCEDWKSISTIADWKKRDQALKDLYVKRLLEDAKVKYAWAFRACMDDKYQTLYYLIHATNSFDGLDIMKSVMYKQGASGTFAYLGPQEVGYRNQEMLFGENIVAFKTWLMKRFVGKSLSYRKVKEDSYMDTQLIDRHYRQAIKELDKEKKINVTNKGPKGGVDDSCYITFPKS